MQQLEEIDSIAEVRPFDRVSDLSSQGIRKFIAQVTEEMMKHPNQIEIPIRHFYSRGVYAREMQMPQGALIVGQIHRYQNLNMLTQGEVSILSIDGIQRMSAPFTYVASPGSQRVIFAHTPVTWTTILGTHETDETEIEKNFLASSYEELNQESTCLLS